MEQFSLHLSRTSNGIELYFPPLRDAGGALALGAFGVLCIALPLAAVYALVPPGVPVPYGLLVLALIGGLIAPFMLCGIAFVCLAAWMAANSLWISANPARIVAVRRLFGIVVSQRKALCTSIATIESDVPARFQNAFSSETRYRLVARSRAGRSDDLVVAESLRGSAAMEGVKQELESVCRIDTGAAAL